jgi:hypothetical protein
MLADGGLAPHDTLGLEYASYDCRDPGMPVGIPGMQNVANHQDRRAATL